MIDPFYSSNCRWFVDSSQASLTAFSAMANDVCYSPDER